MDDMRKLNEMGLMSDEVIAEFQRAIDGAAPDQELQAVKRIMENGPARKRGKKQKRGPVFFQSRIKARA